MRTILSRVLGLFFRRADTDFDDEINAHLEMLVDDNVRSGMTRDEARLAAHKAFGAPSRKSIPSSKTSATRRACSGSIPDSRWSP
jgi:hypothetical protein